MAGNAMGISAEGKRRYQRNHGMEEDIYNPRAILKFANIKSDNRIF